MFDELSKARVITPRWWPALFALPGIQVRAVTALNLLKETVVEAGIFPQRCCKYLCQLSMLRNIWSWIDALGLNSRLSENALPTLCQDLNWFSMGLDDGWTCCGFVLRWCTAIHRRNCSRVRHPSGTWTLGDQPGMLAARAQSTWRIWNKQGLDVKLRTLDTHFCTLCARFAARKPLRFDRITLTGAANSLADFRERCLAEKCHQYLLHGDRTYNGVARNCDGGADDDDNDDWDNVLWFCLLRLLCIDSYYSISNNLSICVHDLHSQFWDCTTWQVEPQFTVIHRYPIVPTIFLLILPF